MPVQPNPDGDPKPAAFYERTVTAQLSERSRPNPLTASAGRRRPRSGWRLKVWAITARQLIALAQALIYAENNN